MVRFFVLCLLFLFCNQVYSQYTKEIFYTIIRELFPNLALQQCKVNTNPIKYL